MGFSVCLQASVRMQNMKKKMTFQLAVVKAGMLSEGNAVKRFNATPPVRACKPSARSPLTHTEASALLKYALD